MIFNLDKKINEAIDDAASKSLWLYHINAGSCNGCDIEIVAGLAALSLILVWIGL